jgi:hypothetical protein
MNNASQTAIFELLPKYQNDQGVDPRRRVSVPAKCTVKNEEGLPVRIAYDPTRDSIYYDKWVGNKPDWRELNLPKINWTNFSKVLGKNDPLLKEYLRICSWGSDSDGYDGSNKVNKKFREITRESQMQETEEDTRLRLRAESAVMDMDAQMLVSLASVIEGEELGNNINVTFRGQEGDMQDTRVLRQIMRTFAADYPELFFKFHDDEDIDIMHNMREALNMGVIKVNNTARAISYAHNNEQIPKSKSPKGVNPLDYFAQRVNKNQDFRDHYENILSIMEGGVSEATTETPASILEAAKEAGVIKWMNGSFHIGEDSTGAKSKNDILNRISENETVTVDGNEVLLADYLISKTRAQSV